jgi:hypothetical protein
MTYNKYTHRWHLDISDTEDLGNVVEEYGNETSTVMQLKLQSLVVYNYIYNRIPLENKDLVEYLLAKDSRFLNPLKEALLAQLMYDLASGGNDVVNQIGIDFKSGGQMMRSRQVQSQVSPLVEQILMNASSDFNLLYPADYGVRLEANKYTVRDY